MKQENYRVTVDAQGQPTGFPPKEGEYIEIHYVDGTIETIMYSEIPEYVPPALPVIPLTNINITNTELVGNIHWIQQGQAFVITGDVALPDGNYMIMLERVVDATTPVDDVRFKASVASGVITINGKFDVVGNYLASAERMNRGLARINAGFELAFDNIEFDVYV